MLIGLAAKNGILIVEFANQRRDEGLRCATRSSTPRRRAAPDPDDLGGTVTGALPLMFATGAGSASRGAIGVVVVFGVLLSTLLSLFVVPAFYLLLARYTHAPEERARALDAMARTCPRSTAATAAETGSGPCSAWVRCRTMAT
jgi:multidrug efflux pump